MTGDRVDLLPIEKIAIGSKVRLDLDSEVWTVVDREISTSQYERFSRVRLVIRAEDGALGTISAFAGEKVRTI